MRRPVAASHTCALLSQTAADLGSEIPGHGWTLTCQSSTVVS
jgi:hypothetical protein